MGFDMKVLVTRPQHQAQALSEGLQRLGFEVVQFPTLKIVPVEDQVIVKETLEKADKYDMMIFISANAVYNAVPYLQSITEKTAIVAMGPASAKALKEAGFRSTYIPESPHTSENLLDLPIFGNINAAQILLITGEGGRNLIANKLSERGAQVTQLPVYRRECPDSDPETLTSFLSSDNNRVIVTTSGDSLRNLLHLTPGEYKQSLLQTPLLVVSPRLEQIARELEDFSEILVAENAQDESIITKIQQWRG